MLIKRLFIVLVLLIAGADYLYGQNVITDPVGKWEIIRVDARLYTQDNDSLLRISTLMTREQISEVHALVPVAMVLDKSHCILTTMNLEEEGSYTLKGGKLLYRSAAMTVQMNAQAGMPMQQLPPVVYEYRLKEDGTLVLELPVSYYKDTQSGLAVKLACTSYYRKQK